MREAASCVIFLLLLPFTLQLSDKQLKYCTQNDNGDLYKYDLTPLGRVKEHFKIVDKNWMYHIALCGEENLDVGGGTEGDAVVQTGDDGNGTKEIHVIGTEVIARYGGEMWVNLILGSGDPYNNHCNKQPRKAQILFICDPDVGMGVPQLLDEANDDASYCFYMFEWSTSLVCPENATKKRPMTAGTLLVLELVVIILVYVVLGVAYKRFVLGARGSEQIPNLTMWKNCGEALQNTVDRIKGNSPVTNGSTNHVININTPTRGDDDDDERLIM